MKKCTDFILIFKKEFYCAILFSFKQGKWEASCKEKQLC